VIAIDFTDPQFYVIDTATDKIIDTVVVDKNTVGAIPRTLTRPMDRCSSR
jgi:hypothetical protein